ncbi:trehalose-phosphatase [Caenimonas koreensis]|uniref:Trehalose 6-phosphate phosphatase n=1 Tax=Caenimonas koreensis DSM 17982 TaxID=1121255 RepID=A0A844B6B1_9BURK|nr:trehalose-phosphatase [Caenimonas koreensis]MRD48733.1 trehalose-phosphatase [Caenimonas koreensis DSM 17982]
MNLVDFLFPSCALFLDFDGTLVDIAPQPDEVLVPSGLSPALESLQHSLGGAVAIISGRPIEQVDAYLAPLRLPSAGVHGAERRDASGEITLLSTYSLERVEEVVQALAARHPDLRIEIKRGSIALHYRQAPQLEAECIAAMEAAVAQSPGVTLLRGKMVAEAKPGGASKGLAIEAFMKEAPFAGRSPVFIGDDITDEVGFATVQRMHGMGVKVGAGTSVAWQRLPSPADCRLQLQAAAAALAAKAAS